MAGYTGVTKRERDVSRRGDHDPAVRIEDLDYEGVDVNLTLPSGWFGTWTAGDDVALEMGMYRAYHRWMEDYCGSYPDRLGGVILACARDIEGSVDGDPALGQVALGVGRHGLRAVRHAARSPGPRAALGRMPRSYDLAVVLHTFTVMPPYAPGGLDTWDNLWLQRSAAHPWCGMRNMAALIGSGVMDRYPKLRIGTLEAGHGWLPFWMMRIDEHAEMIKAALPELKAKPSDYVLSGRYFQSIEIPEGLKVTQLGARFRRRRRAHVRLRLSARREPFPEIGGDGDGVGHAGSAASASSSGTTRCSYYARCGLS